MTLLNWPAQERPREKLLKHGATQLSNAELFAILFGSGTKGKSAIQLAQDLLNHFNGLRGLFSASFQDFCQFPGLGMAKYCQCQAAIELSRRQLKETIENKPLIANSGLAKTFFMRQMRDYQQEVFACLFADNRHHLIHFENLFYGSIRSTQIYPRILIQRCIAYNAAAVIIAHNHPSGNPEPSQSDQDITKLLWEALQLIDVKLLDHLIVGDSRVFSFAEEGLLAPR